MQITTLPPKRAAKIVRFKSETMLWREYQDAYNAWCAMPCDETTRAKDAAGAKWQRAFILAAHAQPRK